MRPTLLILLILAMVTLSFPASGKGPSASATPPWPPDLSSLLEQPYGGGWSPEVHYVEPAGQLGGSTQFVHVQDTLAYIVHGPRLQILDVSDSALPVFVGQTEPFDALPTSVAVSGTVAYVTLEGPGVPHVFDVSNPSAPALLGTCEACGPARGIVIAGDLAYLAAEGRGLEIVDVSNPTSPALLSTLGTPGIVTDLVVKDGLAYVSDGTQGLQIADVSDPNQPYLVGGLDTPGNAWGLDVAGSTAYIADEIAGLRIIDVSTPAHPVEVGRFSSDTPVDVTVAGSIAYLAAWWGGMPMVDVSDPAHPVELGRLDTPGYTLQIALQGTPSDERCPTCAHRAYLADGDGGLRIADVTNPAAPAELGAYTTLGLSLNASLSGSLAFVAGGFRLTVVDIHNPAEPSEIGRIAVPEGSRDVAVVANTAYVAANYGGLLVLDVSDPAAPRRLGYLALPGIPGSVAVAGTVAFLAAESGGLRIVDVSNPIDPIEVGSHPVPGIARAVAVQGAMAYVAAGPAGLVVFDVSDPRHPRLRGTLDTPDDAWDAAVSRSTAYIADRYGGLRLIDIGDPMTPREVGHFATRGEASGVALAFPVLGWGEPSVAFVALGSGGLSAVNVLSVTSPVEIDSLDTPGTSEAVAIAGSVAAIGDGAGGLSLVRLLRDRLETTITPGGGSMATDDGSMVAIFPAGTFTETVSLTYKRLAAREDSRDLLGSGQPFEFSAVSIDSTQPAGLAPGREYAMVLRYSDYELGSASEPSLRLYFRNGGLWLPEPSSQVHVHANALTALPSRLGWWNALGVTQRRYLPLLRMVSALPTPHPTPTATPNATPTPTPRPEYRLVFTEDLTTTSTNGDGCQTGDGCILFVVQVQNLGNRPEGYWLTQAPSLPERWQMWLCWDATCDSSPSPPRRVVAPGAKENIGLRFLLPPDLQNAQVGTVRITGSCDHCTGTVYDQEFTVLVLLPRGPLPARTPEPISH